MYSSSLNILLRTVKKHKVSGVVLNHKIIIANFALLKSLLLSTFHKYVV